MLRSAHEPYEAEVKVKFPMGSIASMRYIGNHHSNNTPAKFA